DPQRVAKPFGQRRDGRLQRGLQVAGCRHADQLGQVDRVRAVGELRPERGQEQIRLASGLGHGLETDTRLGGDPPHARRGVAVLGEQRGRGGDHVLPGALSAFAAHGRFVSAAGAARFGRFGYHRFRRYIVSVKYRPPGRDVMSSVLVCVQPARGHVGPTKPLVAALVAAGHDVAVITGARYRDAFTELGADVTVLLGEVDFDETDLNGSIPGREGLRGPKLGRFELSRFAGAMSQQLRTVDKVLACGVDVVLCDPLFAAGMALVNREDRPRVLALGFLPLTAPTPYRPPSRRPLDRVRGAVMRRFMGWMMAPAQQIAERGVHELVGVETGLCFMDWPMCSDGVLQMTCPGFEFPRTLPAPVHFIGPTTTSSASEHDLPEWWHELDGSRP